MKLAQPILMGLFCVVAGPRKLKNILSRAGNGPWPLAKKTVRRLTAFAVAGFIFTAVASRAQAQSTDYLYYSNDMAYDAVSGNWYATNQTDPDTGGWLYCGNGGDMGDLLESGDNFTTYDVDGTEYAQDTYTGDWYVWNPSEWDDVWAVSGGWDSTSEPDLGGGGGGGPPPPDNDFPGTSYGTSNAEFGGSLTIDSGLSVIGSLSADTLNITNDLHVIGLYQGTPIGNQTNYTIDGGLELWSGYNPVVISSWGAANSWFHTGIDFGDLTYTSTDTPAFNISQHTDGTFFYPTINFTGYDGNTTWVWRQNGWSAKSNSTLLVQQMQLSGNGNLTLSGSSSNHTLQITPAGGNITLATSTAHLRATAASSNYFTLVTGNATVVFTNATSNTTQNITSSNVASAYTSGMQSFGFGANITMPGLRSFAFGNSLDAAYFGSIVLGDSNVPVTGLGSGNVTSWEPADPLFIVGNGASADPLTIYKNGNAIFGDGLTVNGNVTLSGNTTTFSGYVTLGAAGNKTVNLSSAKGDIPLISN